MSNDKIQFKQALIPLFVLCLFCVMVIGITHTITKDKIAENQKQHTLKMVLEVMPLAYDNDLLNDYQEIIDPASFGTDKPVIAYRARLDNEPVGIVFMPVIANGYSGTIELSIGISFDGKLTGVRVNKQQETEGLGDKIDQRNTDWIFGFDGRSLDNTENKAWAVKKDGGEFDQLSGATISPRAVINAVKNTLDYYLLERDRLYQ